MNIADTSKVTFSRYADPVMGPRTFPSPETFEKLQVAVDPSSTLAVDLQAKTVSLVEADGKTVDLGNRLIYQL